MQNTWSSRITNWAMVDLQMFLREITKKADDNRRCEDADYPEQPLSLGRVPLVLPRPNSQQAMRKAQTLGQ